MEAMNTRPNTGVPFEWPFTGSGLCSLPLSKNACSSITKPYDHQKKVYQVAWFQDGKVYNVNIGLYREPGSIVANKTEFAHHQIRASLEF